MTYQYDNMKPVKQPSFTARLSAVCPFTFPTGISHLPMSSHFGTWIPHRVASPQTEVGAQTNQLTGQGHWRPTGTVTVDHLTHGVFIELCSHAVDDPMSTIVIFVHTSQGLRTSAKAEAAVSLQMLSVSEITGGGTMGGIGDWGLGIGVVRVLFCLPAQQSRVADAGWSFRFRVCHVDGASGGFVLVYIPRTRAALFAYDFGGLLAVSMVFYVCTSTLSFSIHQGGTICKHLDGFWWFRRVRVFGYHISSWPFTSDPSYDKSWVWPWIVLAGGHYTMVISCSSIAIL